jgi:hypothetical protein
MSKIVFWFILLFVLSMLIALGANAATLRGNKDSCADLGNLIMQGGEARQAGSTWDQIQTRLAETLTAARKNPESYIQNDADAAFVIRAFMKLWQNKDEPAYIIATRTYHQCMSKEA